MKARRDPIRIVELAAGAALTFGVVFFLLIWVRNAGGLWRDEVVSATVAAKPTWSAMARSLQFDSFPGLLHVLLRLWSAVGLAASDSALRSFGVAVGFAALAAAWFHARTLCAGAPLLTLALFAWSPLAVQWMASLRAYGLGFLLGFLLLALVYRVVERPFDSLRSRKGRWTIAGAAAVAILCVQCLYSNAFLVLAVCAGGVAVAARRKDWKTCAVVLAVGGVAALSLLPYVGILRGYTRFQDMLPTGLTFERIGSVASAALQAAGAPMLWVWMAVLLIGVALALAVQVRSLFPKLDAAARDRALYACLVLAAYLSGYLVYLKTMGLRSEPWYYLGPMAVTAACLDTVVAAVAARTLWPRAAAIAVALAVASLTAPKVYAAVPVRQTNVDLIAAHLDKSAGSNDVILVHPWFCGATFDRYYHGAAFWSTIPPNSDIAIQSLDRLKEQMMLPDPMAPLLERAAAALRSGNRVWLVGGLPMGRGSEAPRRLPPAPNGPSGWNIVPYVATWGEQVGWFLRSHAQTGSQVPPPFAGPVSAYERLDLFVLSGWRP